MTTDLVKYRLTAATTRSLVAKLRASMVTALEHTPTKTGADVLSFKAFVDGTWCKSKRPKPALCRLPLCCLSLPGAASLTTLVTATVECDLAASQTLWRFFGSLMANSLRGRSTTAAIDGDGH